MFQPPADTSTATREIPPGTISATIVDAQEQPVPNAEVRLGILFQNIATGDKSSEKVTRANAEGVVQFSGLETGLAHSYVVSAHYSGARYESAPFNLRTDQGQRVRLHVYPTTTNIQQAIVGVRGFVYVQPRDDVFQFEVLYRIFNLSPVTWLPNGVRVQLPEGAKAISEPEEGAVVRFEPDATAIQLAGSVAPGQQDVRVTFQVPNEGEEEARFQLGLLPHVAELRVLAESAPSMTLDVAGFEPTQVDRGPQGDRVLVTRRVQRAGEALDSVDIRLGGIPVAGRGRWAVLLAALSIAMGGVVVRVRDREMPGTKRPRKNPDLVKARGVLLDELVALETARREERIGPSTYASARRQLIEALTRLELAR